MDEICRTSNIGGDDGDDNNTSDNTHPGIANHSHWNNGNHNIVVTNMGDKGSERVE